MKKILLIVAVVLCIAVAGTALAVTYRSANNETGALTADKYIYLDMGGTAGASLTLLAGDQVTYHVACDIDRSATAPTATLTVTFTDTSESVNLDDVQISFFKDEGCTTPLKLTGTAIDDADGTAVSFTGLTEGSKIVTISGLEDDADFYIRFYIDNPSVTLDEIGGNMALALAKAA